MRNRRSKAHCGITLARATCWRTTVLTIRCPGYRSVSFSSTNDQPEILTIASVQSPGIQVAELSRVAVPPADTSAMSQMDGAVMRLRSHSSMSYRGSGPGHRDEPGEVGNLESVHKSTVENQFYLHIQHNGSRYIGILQCNDRVFLRSSITV